MIVILTPEYRKTVRLNDDAFGTIEVKLKPISGMEYLQLAAQFPEFLTTSQPQTPEKLFLNSKTPEFIKEILLKAIDSISIDMDIEEFIHRLSLNSLLMLFNETMQMIFISQEEANFLKENSDVE